MKRSSREGWVASIPRNQPLPPSMIQAVRCVRTPGEVATDIHREHVLETRLSLLRKSRRMATKMEEQDDDETLADGAKTLLTLTKQAALVGGWAPGQAVQPSVRLRSDGAGLGSADDAILCDAEAETDEDE